MARQCAIIPKVLNKKGEKVDSRLFKDLLSYLSDRASAVNVYLITKSQEFISKWNPRLVLDDNNEPTLRSMLQKTNLSDYIPEKRVLEKLNRDIGHYKKGTNKPDLKIKNSENYKALTDKARKFNRESEFRDEYVAKVENTYNEDSSQMYIGISVEKRTEANSVEADKMEYNESLNEKLRNILASNGVSIGVLTELERRMGINGVTDFNQAKAAAEGTLELIRLAEGIKGEQALPEEFAHFALEALGSNHPLATRLINFIAANGLTEEIIGEEFEEYDRLYKHDEAKLAKEAAGKLLAKHLLQAEEIPAKPYRNLLQRLIASIKNFFRRLSASPIQRAMRQADKDFGSLARNILDGNLDNNIRISNIAESSKFFNVSERVARDKKLLQDIINNELKRLKVYEARNPNSTFNEKQQLLINQLEEQLKSDNEIEGIYSFVENTLSTLQSLSKRLVDVESTSTSNLNDKAKVLRDVRNYLYSYKHILNDIRVALVDEEKHSNNRYGERVRTILRDTTDLLGDLFINYRSSAMPIFVDFIKPFVGESLVVPFGKWKGKVITAEELVETAGEDISFFDRWLDSMADSSSYILKIFDQAVKKSKELARLSTIDVMKQLQAAAIKLEQAGVKGTDWMFERDSKGNLTGRYITEINHGLYREAMSKMFNELREKYGKNPVGEDAEAFKRERNAWFAANMETINGTRRPKKSIYGSKEFNSLNDAQKEFWNTVMNIKAKLDAFLPTGYTKLINTVKIRKDLIERVKSSSGIKSGANQIWENIKDQFIRRGDDTEFGDRATVKDFEGREVQVLPIYYTKLREGESNNDMSTDIVSTLTAYAAMANDYHEMNKVIDVLELGRDYLRGEDANTGLKIQKTKGNKPLVERFKSLGRTVESKVTKSTDDRRIIERLNDYFEMQVYGRYMADEGTFGKTNIDKAKVANFVNRMTSLNSLALNVMSGISNVATGKVMMRIESIAGEFFNEKNTIKADRLYGQSMPAFLAELGNRVKTSKLALWSELFNVLQDYEADIRDVNFDRKTWFSRMANSSALFFMNNAGEHWMQHRTSLALADKYEMKDPDGNIVSLWDAMEVAYTDPNNKKLGAKLQVKKGYTKKDGTAFTQDDIIKFSRKAAAINQRMHGIYNKLDRSAVQRLAIGRMGMMFRKWIKPSLNRRFKSTTYNFDIGEWTEGYYRTTGRFLWQLAKELKEGQFSLAANWGSLDQRERNNIKRAITEVGHFVAVALILGLIDWPDDEDRPWLVKMAEYQARRLYTELGSMIPGPQMLNEGLRILKSPAAGVNTMERTLDLIGLMNPYNYETFGGEEALLKSGRYKGESRATKLFYESPLLPMSKTIYRGLHPEDGIPFFKQ